MELGEDKAWLVPSMVSSEFEPDLGNQQQVVLLSNCAPVHLIFLSGPYHAQWRTRLEGNHMPVMQRSIERQRRSRYFAVINGGAIPVVKRAPGSLLGLAVWFLLIGFITKGSFS